MYTKEKMVYKAKVGKLFVQSVNCGYSHEISLSESDKFARYLTSKEIDFLLTHFPDAQIKELTITEEDNTW